MKKTNVIGAALIGVTTILFNLFCLNASANNKTIEYQYVEVVRQEPADTLIIYKNKVTDDKIAEALQKMMEIQPLITSDMEAYFKAYKQIIEEYADYIDPPESIYDYYPTSEIELIERCVETETYQCSFEAKVNVANVILNRITSDTYGDNASEVIVPGQFCYSRTKISESTKLAVEYAFMFPDTTNGALYFKSGKQTATFGKADYLFTDNVGHHFYK